MPFGETLNMVIDVSRELNLKLILGILRKRVTHDSATPGAERQTLDMPVLREIRRKDNR